MDEIILIGGAPTLGKTYVAKRLSKKLNLPWISTDGIRAMLREVVNKKDFPFLFENIPCLPAEKYLAKYSAKDIVANQNRESIDVWKGVKAFIDTDCNWGSFIVEGIAILPEFVRECFKGNKNIKPLFLLNDNEEQIREIVYTRGLYDEANTYSDDVKEKEVEWALMFNAWIEKETKKYGLPVYKIKKRNYSIDDILKKIK